MTRDDLIQLMAKAHLSYGRHPALRSPVPMQGDIDAMSDALSAIETAGVRLVPVNEKPGQGWLHEAVKDACLRASKNSGGTPPQLLYAPILWAMRDALAASPYAPQKEQTHESD